MRAGLSLLALAGVLISGGAGAQSAEDLVKRGIPGYLDPSTNLFVMAVGPRAPNAMIAADTTLINANVKVTNTISIVSSLLTSSGTITCTATLTLIPLDAGGEVYLETASVPATRSGSTATCSVLVPFGWKLANPAVDKISVTFGISAIDTTKSFTRGESTTLGQIAVPAGGTTTSLTTTARI